VSVAAQGSAFSIRSDGVTMSGDDAGAGPAVVLLHGLTATRRYVVMGSRLLERSGHRVIAYDARGHGRSTPAPERTAYGYEHLLTDLRAVLDSLGLERVILAGASMGAHTAIGLALADPGRVHALCLITPSYYPRRLGGADAFAGWDALAEGLRNGGIEGFARAYDLAGVPDLWRETVEKVLRQRLAAHEHPLAVADALEVVPRSRPFASMSELEGIRAPTVVVASRDQADPGHPLAVGERYAAAIPGARLVVEREGSPIAWQGGRISRLVLELAEQAKS
jgi:pimeloyl-ACP methyl ester carboxylesterase